jgi:hypothetical protein
MQVGGRFRFAMESLDDNWRSELARIDHFDGDQAIERKLAGFVHDSHAAAPNLLKQFVVSKDAFFASVIWSRLLRVVRQRAEAQVQEAFRTVTERSIYRYVCSTATAFSIRWHNKSQQASDGLLQDL